MASQSQEAAAGVLEDMQQAEPTDAPTEPEGQEQAPEEDVFEFEPDLPAEIEDNLEDDEPEYNYDDEEEEEEPAESEDYDEDEALIAARNKLAAKEKRIKHLEAQDLKRKREDWVAKDGRYFPFADVEDIAKTCKSRKEFDKRAKAANERVKKLPGVQKFLAEQQSASKAAKDKEVAEQWGDPSAGSGLVPAEAEELTDRLRATRKRGGLRGFIDEGIKSGKLKL